MEKKDNVLILFNLFFSAIFLLFLKHFHFEKNIYNIHDFGNFVLIFFSVSGAVCLGKCVSKFIYSVFIFIKNKLRK